jgi:hypothetical protein
MLLVLSLSMLQKVFDPCFGCDVQGLEDFHKLDQI